MWDKMWKALDTHQTETDAIQADSDKYDKATDHGRTRGVVFGVIGPECGRASGGGGEQERNGLSRSGRPKKIPARRRADGVANWV